mmetsp:Transcript_25908/g.74296  ORF Transcript_25908/g.74296 Transcript_25908/m.74296 type:complete len:548 (-) Transcript_25908:198-1841(-)
MAGRSCCLFGQQAHDSGSCGSSSSSSRSSSSSSSGSSHSGSEETHGQAMPTATQMAVRLRLRLGLGFTSASHLKVASKPAADLPTKALTADNSGKAIEQSFDMDRETILGEGGYASVFLARDKQTGAVRAVKCVLKSLVADKQRLQHEVDIMLALDHPNVLRCFETFEDQRFVYLVLELCAGGDLFDYIARSGRVPEERAAVVMQLVFRSIAHIHTLGICHRDIKPENFLFRDDGPPEGNELKLADFGIAAIVGPRGKASLRTKTGTPQYVAPEVLSHAPHYGLECDLWSCGVLMYLLLSHRLPFKGTDEASTLSNVLLAKLSFPAKAFAGVSQEAKHLMSKLVMRDPQRRCTAEEALHDRWVLAWAPAVGSPTGALSRPLAESICSFRSAGRLKQTALRLVARHLDARRLHDLGGVFARLDADGNGMVALEELARSLEDAGVPKEQFASVMAALDGDGNGEVNYSEFLAASLERRLYLEESACWSAFRIFDRNNDGKISQEELAEVLTSSSVADTFGDAAARLLHEADLNADGFIDFDEFMVLMRK